MLSVRRKGISVMKVDCRMDGVETMKFDLGQKEVALGKQAKPFRDMRQG